jgi:hypothetical protein
MKKLIIIAVLFSVCLSYVQAQGELDQQQKVFFRNEKSFGISLNSDGWSFGYRGAKRIDYRNKHIFELDFGSLRHPKEYRLNNPYTTGGSFVFGKLNSTFFIRGGIGRQHELYKKADLGGIAIRYFYSAGPVLAFYKPVYYRVLYQNPMNPNEFIIKEEKFSSSISVPAEIYGRASFFKGFDELKVLPGLYGKFGFNFEYSKEDKVIHAIEVGTQLNAFPKEIPIMASEHNKAIFFSFFVSYRFGMIIDPLDPESNKLSNVFKKKKSK